MLPPTAREPRYQEIANRFREDVRAGILHPGERLPSFAEMKQQFGASQATMDRAFAILEQDGLVVREQGRGTFVAQPSRPIQTGLIGFVGSDFAIRERFPYSAQIAEGIEDVVARAQKRILLLRHDSPVGWDQVEGVLLHQSAESETPFLPARVPCVSVLEAKAGIASVASDDYDGARQATQHLLQLGHQNIAFLLQFNVVPWLRRRAAGFRDALDEAGIKHKPGWVWDPQVGHPAGGYRQWGLESVQAWLARDWKKQGFTALIAQNDLAAIGAIEAFRIAGLRVPQDVSVMGYDGTEMCEYVSPSITAIEVPLREIGAKATEMLLQRISGEFSGDESVILPVRLKRGKSTAPPP